jgi:hypothetical protein
VELVDDLEHFDVENGAAIHGVYYGKRAVISTL